MELRHVLTTLVLCALVATIFTQKIRKNKQFTYVGQQRARTPFKEFYPRPASMDKFRRQRLYPIRAEDRFNQISSSTPLGEVNLRFNLHFFGFKFTYIWVHRDGYLTFSRGLREYSLPIQFPTKNLDEAVESDPTLIAPWFGIAQDFPIEIPESGVYVRLVEMNKESDDMLRERIIVDFREGMIGAGHFTPSYALIVTWRNATFFHRRPEQNLKTNTYQVVIATDELKTYCMFNYDNIEGTSRKDGMIHFPPFVGFNAGNRTRAFELIPYSQSVRIVLLEQQGYGNNLKGRWIFQIDEEVLPGSCVNPGLDSYLRGHSRLTIVPSGGNMLGSTMVNVTGPCFGHEATILCRFDTINVTAIYRDINHVSCFQPFFPHNGYIDLSVSVNGGPFDFVGKYLIEPPDVEDIVIKHARDISEYPTSIMIEWKPEFLSWNGRAKASLHLWGYREPLENEDATLTYIDTIAEDLIVGTGFYEMDPLELQKRENYGKIDMEFGFLSLNSTFPLTPADRQSPVIWSRPTPLAWYFRPQWERKYGDQWRDHFCRNWTRTEDPWIYKSSFGGLSCPCTAAKAELDVGRFLADGLCNTVNEECGIFHDGSERCFQSVVRSKDGHGQLCCYDKYGELVRTTDTIYGSRPFKSHLFGKRRYDSKGNVPVLSHWQVDTMPFFFCCKWVGGSNSDLCKLYNERRKSDDCISYQEPGVGSVFGDPHFYTFDLSNYTFNGKGEFVLVRDRTSEANIDIQGRFEQPKPPIAPLGTNATKLTAVVAKVGQSSVVEIRLRPQAAAWRYKLFLIVDGEYYYIWKPVEYYTFKNVTIYQRMETWNMSHIIVAFHSGVGVEVINRGGNLGVHVYLPRQHFKRVSGLLGNWSDSTLDDFTLPGGKQWLHPSGDDKTIHARFGMRWRLTEVYDEDVGYTLFTHDAIPFQEFDDAQFKPKFLRDINSTISKGLTKRTCSDSLFCAYDLHLTSNEEFAKNTRNHESAALSLHWRLSNRDIRCPSVPTPINSKKSTVRVYVHTVVRMMCKEGYHAVGISEIECNENGTWSGELGKCLPNKFDDFYPRPSTLEEFRRQLLYPVKEDGYIWDTKATMPYRLQFNLPFFGSTFDKFFIYGSGIIGLPGAEDLKYPAYSPRDRIDRFLEEDKTTICPLFSNDTSFSGTVEAGLYVQEINVERENDTLLQERLRVDFNEGMIGAENFDPKYVIITTWRNSSAEKLSDKTNTFQVLIATDEIDTYMMFNYDTIQHVNYVTERGKKEVANFVGFSGPRRTRIFELEPYSRSTDIALLTERGYGNQLKGRWIFKVDEEILMGSCINEEMKRNGDQRNPLAFYPRSGVMLGGTLVNITGPCFHPERDITCKFGSAETNGVYLDINRVTCVQPQLFYYGYVDLTVFIDGKFSGFVGKYYIGPAGILKADISIKNRAEMSEYPTSMIVTWKPESLSINSTDRTSIHLWGYRETPGEQPRLTYIDVISQHPIPVGKGSYELDPVQLQKKENYGEIEMEFGFLSMNITEPSAGNSRVIWSTPMPLAWYFRPQWENKYKDGWKRHFCEEWISREELQFPYDSNLISCPCTLEQAEADRGRFFPDASCSYSDKSCEILHKDAHHCVRYGRPLPDGSGQLCCYDSLGELIRSADSMYSGTPSRSNFYGKPPYNKEMTVPSLSHWYQDVVPFFFCCKWAGEFSDTCTSFKEKRKSSDCTSYEPPGVGFVFGDPHFITFDGTIYTFNGKGEFVLVRARDVKHTLDIQGRFDEVFFYLEKDGKGINATKLTGLVAKDGTSSTVEFRLHPHPEKSRYKINVVVDKEYIRFGTKDPRVQSFKGVTIYQPRGIFNMSHVIAVFDSGAGVELITTNGNMGATVYLPSDYMNITKGLLGKWSNEKADDFLLPNGTVLDLFRNLPTKTIHKSFGMEWRLTDLMNKAKGHSLFYHDSAPFYFYDDPNFQPMYDLKKNSSAFPSEEEIKRVCGDSETCLFDLVVSKDTSFSSGTKLHKQRALLLRTTIEKQEIRCPSLPSPNNGDKSSHDYKIGSVARYRCNTDYKLQGNNMQTCQINGKWTGTSPSCIPKKSNAV